MNIPAKNLEIEQIYAQVLADPYRSLAFCSAGPDEGVTSLAISLAQRNLLAGHSTLLVDLNLFRPSLKPLFQERDDQSEPQSVYQSESKYEQTCDELINGLAAPELVTSDHDLVVLNGISAPVAQQIIMKLRQPGMLEKVIKNWLTQYDTVLIDTSPLNKINANNIPAQRVAGACDGAVMVVMAAKTSQDMVTNAINKLNNANATLLGCVINDRDNPALKNELLREINKLGPRFNWLSSRLKTWLQHNRLLLLET
jgi:protein-tyrosine kinase